jgi:hypothetical protein
MPQGGVITIAARNVPASQSQDPGRDFVSIAIADTGVGMSPEVLAGIFEPFFTTKELGKGSGLGLPQVYGFVQQSGGSIRAESLVGRGTTMTMLLPRSATPPPDRSAPEVADLNNTARRRALMGTILLVEDDDEVATLVTEMLRELGYRVARVASAQAALGVWRMLSILTSYFPM